MISRAEESVDRWPAGALAGSLVFFPSAEAIAAADERGRGKDRIMQGGHPFELRQKGGMDVCRGSKKRVFASVCHPFRNGFGNTGPRATQRFCFPGELFSPNFDLKNMVLTYTKDLFWKKK